MLCREVETSCAELREAEALDWTDENITDAGMGTLGMPAQVVAAEAADAPKPRQWLRQRGYASAVCEPWRQRRALAPLSRPQQQQDHTDELRAYTFCLR